jgi:hypothetical protein
MQAARPQRGQKQQASRPFWNCKRLSPDQAFFLGRAISVRSAFGAEELEPAQFESKPSAD